MALTNPVCPIKDEDAWKLISVIEYPTRSICKTWVETEWSAYTHFKTEKWQNINGIFTCIEVAYYDVA